MSRNIICGPRGLDISKRYRVTWDNSGQTCEVDGFTLVQQGVVVVPRASHVDRLWQNLDIFDFTLSDDDLARMAALATGELVNDQDPRTWEEF